MLQQWLHICLIYGIVPCLRQRRIYSTYENRINGIYRSGRSPVRPNILRKKCKILLNLLPHYALDIQVDLYSRKTYSQGHSHNIYNTKTIWTQLYNASLPVLAEIQHRLCNTSVSTQTFRDTFPPGHFYTENLIRKTVHKKGSNGITL